MPRKQLPRAIDLTAERDRLRAIGAELKVVCFSVEQQVSHMCNLIARFDGVPTSRPNGRRKPSRGPQGAK